MPLGGWGVPHVVLTPDEVEDLARREHDRWRAERAAAGWQYGPQRDNAKRLNPLLVPWDDLPAAAQDDSREAARRIPRCSPSAGLEVLRLDPVPVSRRLLRLDDPEAYVERVAEERDPADAGGVERGDLDPAAQLDRALARGVGVGHVTYTRQCEPSAPEVASSSSIRPPVVSPPCCRSQ